MKRVLLVALRQPILHFAVLGGALFWAHALVGGDSASANPRRVTFTAEQFAELDIDDPDQLVAEEVLYREAMSIGLDRGDPVVRQRLVQKMEFLLEGVQPEPTDAELQRYLDAHAGDFRLPATVSFEHVYFGSNRHADGAEQARAFATAPTDPTTAGEAFVAGRVFNQRKKTMIAGLFGDGFAEALFAAPVGTWYGPIESELGAHAVRITELVAERAATVDDARPRLKAEYTRARRAEIRRAAIAELVDSYDVRLPNKAPAAR